MLVTVFAVLETPEVTVPFQTLYEAFGTDIPMYSDLGTDDPRGHRYELCVSQTSEEIRTLCETYNYPYGTPSYIDVDPSQFNSNYKIAVVDGQYALVPV